MKMNSLLKGSLPYLLLVSGFGFVACEDGEPPVTPPPANSKYTVGASVDGEGYYLTTDDLQTGPISVVGNGFEGWANLSVSVDGYLYILNNTEALTEKFELTSSGPVKVDAISNSALAPEGFFRYIIDTGDGDIFMTDSPNEEGNAPYAIVDLATFTVESHGFVTLPDVNGRDNLWISPLVNGNEIYFGSLYGDAASWTDLADSLITVKFDYPSLTNPEVLVSTASAGTTGGYRTNGSFKVENGDIYQYNLNSFQWNGTDELAGKPTVFVRIRNGEYDDSFVLDVSAEFDEPIAIWNAWYAGDDIVYANVVREADIPTWPDLLQNTGTLVEINLATGSVTELNLPKASFRDIFSLNCIEDGKFYIPVCVTGGEANIYEITIGGGANGFTKGAELDGSNVSVNALFRNF